MSASNDGSRLRSAQWYAGDDRKAYIQGLLAVLREVRALFDPTAVTVTGRPLVDYLDTASIWDPEVIRSRALPLLNEGGIAVLRGNLAPLAPSSNPQQRPRTSSSTADALSSSTTSAVHSGDTSQVVLWMIETNYNDESFFVRHCYFTRGSDPFGRLKRPLKADIDEDAWQTLHRTTSRSFDKPETGCVAVKVINDYGDEVMKIFEV